MHFSASHSLTQPLLDCILYLTLTDMQDVLTLTQYPYDPGTLPRSDKSVYPWASVSEIQPTMLPKSLLAIAEQMNGLLQFDFCSCSTSAGYAGCSKHVMSSCCKYSTV